MAKYQKREVSLIDEGGVEWIRAALTPPAIKRIIRLYREQEIWLEELPA